jgi:hypothetical protein
MLFVQSIGGRSHAREEDTNERDLEVAVRVLDALAERVLGMTDGPRAGPKTDGL